MHPLTVETVDSADSYYRCLEVLHAPSSSSVISRRISVLRGATICGWMRLGAGFVPFSSERPSKQTHEAQTQGAPRRLPSLGKGGIRSEGSADNMLTEQVVAAVAAAAVTILGAVRLSRCTHIRSKMGVELSRSAPVASSEAEPILVLTRREGAGFVLTRDHSN
jgi:hypothetical protein